MYNSHIVKSMLDSSTSQLKKENSWLKQKENLLMRKSRKLLT